MAKYPWRNASRLRKLYKEERLSTTEIADRWDTGNSTIQKWLGRHGIDARDPAEAQKIRLRKDTMDEREKAIALYEDGLSQPQIADELDRPVMTVRYWFYQMDVLQENVECPTCGEGFLNENGMKVHHAKTHGESISGVGIECAYCGNHERVERQRVENPGNTFCSAECMGKYRSENFAGENATNWKGGYKPYYGPNWELQRKLALQRDENTCQLCGGSGENVDTKLDVHHIRPLRKFESENDIDYESANKIENLITLCHPCHMRAEHISPLLPQPVD